MNLAKKKELAAKVLGVGKNRIGFISSHLPEIKEAITRQDIIDLQKAGAIQVKEVSGRKKLVKRKNRRRKGKIKRPVNQTKKDYVIITRKLRTFLKHLSKTGKIDQEKHAIARKRVRARKFKSKRHLNESLGEL